MMRERALAYVSNGGSLRQLAQRIGVSRSSLSRYLKGEEVEGVEQALQRYFLRMDGEMFVETRAARMIFEVLESCYREQEIGVIIGPAGVGKSTALQRWLKRNPERGVMVTVTVTHTGRELITNIAERLGLLPSGNTYRILETVSRVLRDEPRVVIVDEADLLNIRSLEILRALHDLSGVGLVLSGMERLYYKMTLGHDRMENLAQLYSRVGYKAILPMPGEEDLRKVLEVFGVDAGLLPEFQRIARKTGMRGVVKAIRRGQRVAAINQRELDVEILRKVAEHLLMGLERR